MIGKAADKHDWHLFDADRDIYCRQLIPSGAENRWELENRITGRSIIVPDEEFDKIREGKSTMAMMLND